MLTHDACSKSGNFTYSDTTTRFPRGITLYNGELYLTDENHLIRKVTPPARCTVPSASDLGCVPG